MAMMAVAMGFYWVSSLVRVSEVKGTEMVMLHKDQRWIALSKESWSLQTKATLLGCGQSPVKVGAHCVLEYLAKYNQCLGLRKVQGGWGFW